MNRTVQQNAATAEESSSASEEMNAQAAHMKDISDELLKLVKGDAKGIPGSDQPNPETLNAEQLSPAHSFKEHYTAGIDPDC